MATIIIAAGLVALAVVAAAAMLVVYRRVDCERVAQQCAHDAAAAERAETIRCLRINSNALRKSGRRQDGRLVEQLIAVISARKLEVNVTVSLSHPKGKPDDHRTETGEAEDPAAAAA